MALLERCKAGLRPDGIVVIKENVCKEGFIVDPVSYQISSRCGGATSLSLQDELQMQNWPAEPMAAMLAKGDAGVCVVHA